MSKTVRAARDDLAVGVAELARDFIGRGLLLRRRAVPVQSFHARSTAPSMTSRRSVSAGVRGAGGATGACGTSRTPARRRPPSVASTRIVTCATGSIVPAVGRNVSATRVPSARPQFSKVWL